MSDPLGKHNGTLWIVRYFVKGKHNYTMTGYTTNEALAEEIQQGRMKGGRIGDRVWKCEEEKDKKTAKETVELVGQKVAKGGYQEDDVGPPHDDAWTVCGDHATTTRRKFQSKPDVSISVANEDSAVWEAVEEIMKARRGGEWDEKF
jgi:hypothetical protein